MCVMRAKWRHGKYYENKVKKSGHKIIFALYLQRQKQTNKQTNKTCLHAAKEWKGPWQNEITCSGEWKCQHVSLCKPIFNVIALCCQGRVWECWKVPMYIQG